MFHRLNAHRCTSKPWMPIALMALIGVTGCSSSPDADRLAAEWVLSTNGKVRLIVDGSELEVAGDERLPSKPFRVRSIAWDIYPGDVNAHVTDQDLLRISPLTELRDLDLWAAQVSDAGMIALLSLKALERLQLSQTQLSDAGLDHLVSLSNLKEIGLIGTQVTTRGVRRFQRVRPDCRVLHGPGADNS